MVGIKSQIGYVIANSVWIVGTGDKINCRTDNWLGTLLVELMQIPGAFHSGLSCSLHMAIVNLQIEVPSFVLDYATGQMVC